MIRKIDRMCNHCGLSDPSLETEDLWRSRSSSENVRIASKALARGDRFFAKCLMDFERERSAASSHRYQHSHHWEGFWG